MTNNSSNSLSLQSLLEKDKLNGSNFVEWYKNLMIFFKQERKLYVLQEVLPQPPTSNATMVERDAYKKHEDDLIDVAYLMFATMNPELQKFHEEMSAFEFIEHLKQLYHEKTRQMRFEISKALYQSKMAERECVETHVLKMMGYVDSLEKLGFPLDHGFATDIILQSLPENYSQFIMNYNMNKTDKPLSDDLLHMLREAEKEIKKITPNDVLMIQNGKKKVRGKSKAKGKCTNIDGKSNQVDQKAKPKGGVTKEVKCFFCRKNGHFKRNCKAYLKELERKKASVTSTN